MILLDKPKLRFLLAGRVLEITVPRTDRSSYRLDRTYAVRVQGGRSVICRAEIVEATKVVTDDDRLVWALKIKQAKLDENPRLLRAGAPRAGICAGCKRGLPDGASRCPRCGRKRPMEQPDDHGYTSLPHLSLADAGEAVDEQTQERLTKFAHARDVNRGREPERMLRDGLLRELEQWRERSGGRSDPECQAAIRGIERQLKVLDRKLKAA